jgi:tetratricopeptide (TPR) repeat protein
MAFPVCKKNNSDPGLKLEASSPSHYIFAFVCLLVILGAIYSNSFSVGWLFDDNENVLFNKNIEMTSLNWDEVTRTFYGRDASRTHISRPLSYLTFGLNYLVGEYGVVGYHLVNFIIHYLTGIFLFLFLYNTLRLPVLQERYCDSAYGIALLSVFFWATHPIQVSAVTYIVQRMAILAALFSIMAMYFYLKARVAATRKGRIIFFVFCGLSGVLAFASKENGAMLPVSLWLFDLFLLQGVQSANVKKYLKLIALPLVVLGVLALLYGQTGSLFSGYENRPFTLYERLLTQPRVLLMYLGLLLYPLESRLTMFHDVTLSTGLFTPWTTLPAIIIVTGFIIVGLMLGRRQPLLGYCIVFFFINHLIEGSVIPLELIYEHRNYLPSMLFFVLPALLMVAAINYFSYRKSIQYLIAIVFAFLLAAQAHTTYARNRLFSNEYLFWLDAIDKAPLLSRPRNNLGVYLWNRGYDLLSYEQFSLAIWLNNGDTLKMPAIYHENIAFFFLKREKYELAMKHLLESSRIQVKPTVRTLYGLSLALQAMGDRDKAKFFIEQAIAAAPDREELRELLSLIRKREAAAKKSLTIDQ